MVIKGKKSIRVRLIAVFVITVFVFSGFFILSIRLKNSLTQEFESNAQSNIKLSQLSLEIDKSSKAFESYIFTNNIDSYKEFEASNVNIKSIMNYIDRSLSLDTESGIYYRNLQNMYEYYISLSNQIMIKERNSVEVYEMTANHRTLTGYMNIHSQRLMTSYLNYSNENYMNLLQNYKRLENNLYALMIVVGLLTIISGAAIVNEMLISVKILSTSAYLIANGNLDIKDIDSSNYKELNTVVQAFNKMKNNIVFYIQELNNKKDLELTLKEEQLKSLEKDKLLKESQIMALQMQMDPHFLFNTLNMIARIALFEDAKETIELIESTAKILRYNMKNKGELVNINEELEVLGAYIKIQQVRFQEQLEFEIIERTCCKRAMIPPMTLQPIVENSIIHGFKNMEGKGKISVFIESVEEFISITVSDNGIGMSGEKINLIFDNKDRYSHKGHTTGLGVSNVKERLELFFGNRGIMIIDSKENLGTTVSIKIPCL